MNSPVVNQGCSKGAVTAQECTARVSASTMRIPHPHKKRKGVLVILQNRNREEKEARMLSSSLTFTYLTGKSPIVIDIPYNRNKEEKETIFKDSRHTTK